MPRSATLCRHAFTIMAAARRSTALPATAEFAEAIGPCDCRRSEPAMPPSFLATRFRRGGRDDGARLMILRGDAGGGD